MTMLSATGIVVRRGGRAILDGVSLRAGRGEFIAVIGPNGAGKSTLLAALAGLLTPEEGAVAFDGTALSRIAGMALARRRAFLPQNPRCEWPISVERLVGAWSHPHLACVRRLVAGRSGAHRPGAGETAISRTGANQPATTLSGGELAPRHAGARLRRRSADPDRGRADHRPRSPPCARFDASSAGFRGQGRPRHRLAARPDSGGPLRVAHSSRCATVR